MWQSRTAVLEDDWATMESLLGACGGVLGLSGAPLPPGCAVPPAVLAETALYRAESNNRKAVAALSRGIVAGAPEGEVGRLSLSSVDVRPVSSPASRSPRCSLFIWHALLPARRAARGGAAHRRGHRHDDD